MKKYKVTVNGTAYEIELEELTGAAPAPAPAAAAPAAAPAGGEQVTSPMPGTILDVKVTQGASVKKGDVLMILEAMKMENEIMCPRDGKVASIHAAKGAAVESGALLCVIQ
ncbi:biotin/lipoyl-containing protein [uncultured Oscillibacter sp.]|uniref:biotin/lipoyl-containing protein n=1 Tax=uncultured Oscillibacter sp. TaxID=876091 RepID=UPI0025ECAE8C|nr:biotin/lipoyl-containing protein [uncultured Oscillibacter sp.]